MADYVPQFPGNDLGIAREHGAVVGGTSIINLTDSMDLNERSIGSRCGDGVFYCVANEP